MSLVASLLASVSVVSGCAPDAVSGGRSDDAVTVAIAVRETGPDYARIEILTSGFTWVVDATGAHTHGAPRPGHGHAHVYVDGSLVAMADGPMQRVALTPGARVLRVELTGEDHRVLLQAGEPVAAEVELP